jgi:hypothetical protein
VTVKNSTFSGNSAGSALGAGGIENNGSDSGSATLTIGSTILKAGASGVNITNSFGTVTSLGHNLSSDAAGGDGTTGPGGFLNATGDKRNTDPLLGPLAFNGGPTQTHAIGCDSPALDAGSTPDLLTNDQRGPGFARTVGTGTDIGAFEIQTACNTAPTITAATGVTRQQGAASSNSQIATVSDNEDPPTSLTVTVDGGTSSTVNGVTVSTIDIDNAGTVTADVVASCSATSATFTLRVTDTGGLYNEDTLTVSVTANGAPVITLNAPAVLQPNVNHSYRAFTIPQMVQSATDGTTNVINNVVIEKVTSDEVQDSPGPGDGSTLNDIVIASNCKSVQLRAERDGTKNGRVYSVTLRVSDSCNDTRAVYKVSVPVGNKKTAVDSGVAYTVNSNCQL